MTDIKTLILTLFPIVAFGQSSEDLWSNLSRLRAGQKIEVVDMKLRPSTGKFAAVTEREITVLVGQNRLSIPRADVLSVKNREGSHRGRHVLLGLAIGAAGGLAVGAVKGATYHEEGETPVFLLVYTPIGAAIGGAVGAALPAGGGVTVYRAKAASRP